MLPVEVFQQTGWNLHGSEAMREFIGQVDRTAQLFKIIPTTQELCHRRLRSENVFKSVESHAGVFIRVDCAAIPISSHSKGRISGSGE